MPLSYDFCRLCAQSFDTSTLLNIFSENKSGAVSLEKLFAKYLPFPVSANDNLTHHVCKLCCAHVIRWQRFITACVKAQAKLKNLEKKPVATFTPEISADSRTQGTSDTILNTHGKALETNILPESVIPIQQSESSFAAKRKKTNYCIARWCNNSNKTGISLFRVPKDRNRALKWLSAAERMDLAVKDATFLYGTYMCAAHFEKEMFVNEHCKTLNRNAFPTIFAKPDYADKIEEALTNCEIYPKELQGVRLKSILPKSTQKSQNLPAKGFVSNPHILQDYTQFINIEPEVQQELGKPLQDVLLVTDSITNNSNIHFINLSSFQENASQTIEILGVQDSEGVVREPQVLNLVTDMNNEVPSETLSLINVSDGFETSLEEVYPHNSIQDFGESSSFNCDNFQSEVVHQTEDIDKVNKPGTKEVECGLTNNLIDLINSDMFCETNSVTMFDRNQIPTTDVEGGNSGVLEVDNGVDRNVPSDLGLLVIPSEDNQTSESNVTSSVLDQNSLDFPLKEVGNKEDLSNCLENIVGSQDLLLMHSSSSHIEQDHGLRHDKNLNNLCTVVREPIAETSVCFGDRSVLADASVRTIECTSPNHGQALEELIFNQFLDSE